MWANVMSACEHRRLVSRTLWYSNGVWAVARGRWLRSFMYDLALDWKGGDK
jgi:hypothetical protein